MALQRVAYNQYYAALISFKNILLKFGHAKEESNTLIGITDLGKNYVEAWNFLTDHTRSQEAVQAKHQKVEKLLCTLRF